MDRDARTDPTRQFVRHTLIAIALVVMVLVLWRIWYALLLAFGAVLFAVFLRHLAQKFHALTRLPVGVSLLAVALGLLGLLVGAGVLAGAAAATELNELGQALRRALGQIEDYLASTSWGGYLLETAREQAQGGADLLSSMPGVMFTALDALLAFVIVLFAGFYLAIAPHLYTEGAVRLLPRDRQPRMREVLGMVGQALWLWLLARMAVMVLVAGLTWAGLAIVGVPLALPLALVAGLLEFIPFFGPILAGVPILLVALTVDPATALQAAVLVLVIQQVEGNVLEPLVEQKAVSLPPALILVAAVAFMLLFGPLGAVFASPLLLVAIVAIKKLYMEDALGQPTRVPEPPAPPSPAPPPSDGG